MLSSFAGIKRLVFYLRQAHRYNGTLASAKKQVCDVRQQGKPCPFPLMPQIIHVHISVTHQIEWRILSVVEKSQVAGLPEVISSTQRSTLDSQGVQFCAKNGLSEAHFSGIQNNSSLCSRVCSWILISPSLPSLNQARTQFQCRFFWSCLAINHTTRSISSLASPC